MRQVREESDDEQHVGPDEKSLAHLGPGALTEHLRDPVRDGRPGGRPLIEPRCDQRRVPEQQGEHDERDQTENQISLTEVAALEPLGALHLSDPERGRNADEHQHDEEIDEKGKPALMAEPR